MRVSFTKKETEYLNELVRFQRVFLLENLQGSAEAEYQESGGEIHRKEDADNLKLARSIGKKLEASND